MKKLLTAILAIQLMIVLSGCCCPCAKKMNEQKDAPAQESTPTPPEKTPAN